MEWQLVRVTCVEFERISGSVECVFETKWALQVNIILFDKSTQFENHHCRI